MLVNKVNNLADEGMTKLKQIVSERTKPDTVNNLGNGNLGFNNLNSVLKNVGESRVVKYIQIPKTETVKIEDNIIKEIASRDNSKNDKMALNTNIKRNSKQNIDLYFLPKRVDRFGAPIVKGGKHKVTFIDRITKNNFTVVIKVESFKEYNKMEEVSNTKRNNCCLIS